MKRKAWNNPQHRPFFPRMQLFLANILASWNATPRPKSSAMNAAIAIVVNKGLQCPAPEVLSRKSRREAQSEITHDKILIPASVVSGAWSSTISSATKSSCQNTLQNTLIGITLFALWPLRRIIMQFQKTIYTSKSCLTHFLHFSDM